MKKVLKQNEVTAIGKIVSELELNHEVFGEKMYVCDVEIERKSGQVDTIPTMISERLLEHDLRDYYGRMCKICGTYKSYNIHLENGKSRCFLAIYADVLETDLDNEDLANGNFDYTKNDIHLIGYICKTPTFRITPRGREIADCILAVNMPYGKSVYIPCIAWGKTARWLGRQEVSTCLELFGRIQSRDYTKSYDNGESEIRTAYEVSIGKCRIFDEEYDKEGYFEDDNE